MSDRNIRNALRLAESMGRKGDTILAHINPQEAALLKRRGGSGKRNPKTGLLEFADDSASSNDGSDSGSSNPGDIAGGGFGSGNVGGGNSGYSGNGGEDSPSESSGGPGGGGNGGGSGNDGSDSGGSTRDSSSSNDGSTNSDQVRSALSTFGDPTAPGFSDVAGGTLNAGNLNPIGSDFGAANAAAAMSNYGINDPVGAIFGATSLPDLGEALMGATGIAKPKTSNMTDASDVLNNINASNPFNSLPKEALMSPTQGMDEATARAVGLLNVDSSPGENVLTGININNLNNNQIGNILNAASNASILGEDPTAAAMKVASNYGATAADTPAPTSAPAAQTQPTTETATTAPQAPSDVFNNTLTELLAAGATVDEAWSSAQAKAEIAAQKASGTAPSGSPEVGPNVGGSGIVDRVAYPQFTVNEDKAYSELAAGAKANPSIGSAGWGLFGPTQESATASMADAINAARDPITGVSSSYNPETGVITAVDPATVAQSLGLVPTVIKQDDGTYVTKLNASNFTTPLNSGALTGGVTAADVNAAEGQYPQTSPSPAPAPVVEPTGVITGTEPTDLSQYPTANVPLPPLPGENYLAQKDENGYYVDANGNRQSLLGYGAGTLLGTNTPSIEKQIADSYGMTGSREQEPQYTGTQEEGGQEEPRSNDNGNDNDAMDSSGRGRIRDGETAKGSDGQTVRYKDGKWYDEQGNVYDGEVTEDQNTRDKKDDHEGKKKKDKDLSTSPEIDKIIANLLAGQTYFPPQPGPYADYGALASIQPTGLYADGGQVDGHHYDQNQQQPTVDQNNTWQHHQDQENQQQQPPTSQPTDQQGYDQHDHDGHGHGKNRNQNQSQTPGVDSIMSNLMSGYSMPTFAPTPYADYGASVSAPQTYASPINQALLPQFPAQQTYARGGNVYSNDALGNALRLVHNKNK